MTEHPPARDGAGRRARQAHAAAAPTRCPSRWSRSPGAALIDHVLDRSAAVGVRDVVVNVHHLARHDRSASEARTRHAHRAVAAKPELLETGGGVTQGAAAAGRRPVLRRQRRRAVAATARRPRWRASPQPGTTRTMDALLLLQPTVTARRLRRARRFLLDPLGRRDAPARPAVAPFVFAGVQILHPRLFDGRAAGRVLAQPTVRPRGRGGAAVRPRAMTALWFHVGTPDSIGATEAELDYVRRRSARRGTMSDSEAPAEPTHASLAPPSARLRSRGRPAVPRRARRAASADDAGGDPLALARATVLLPTRRACRTLRERSCA